jgi:aminoacrylate hydrolase
MGMANVIHSREQGKGAAVVLISGLGGLADFWVPVVERLSSYYTVITFDHPGVGQSDISGKPTIQGIKDAVLKVMAERGVEKAHIVGHSTGSLVAQALVLDHPDKVKSLVLSSGWCKPDKRFRDFFEYRKFILRELGATAYMELTKLVAYPSEWYANHYAKDEPVNLKQPLDVDEGMILDRIDMLLGYSRREELKHVSHPTLIVGAHDDYVIPFHHSEEMEALISGASLVAINGGHFSPVTRTVEYTSLLSGFWENLSE